jgi:hypothetical protein
VPSGRRRWRGSARLSSRAAGNEHGQRGRAARPSGRPGDARQRGPAATEKTSAGLAPRRGARGPRRKRRTEVGGAHFARERVRGRSRGAGRRQGGAGGARVAHPCRRSAPPGKGWRVSNFAALVSNWVVRTRVVYSVEQASSKKKTLGWQGRTKQTAQSARRSGATHSPRVCVGGCAPLPGGGARGRGVGGRVGEGGGTRGERAWGLLWWWPALWLLTCPRRAEPACAASPPPCAGPAASFGEWKHTRGSGAPLRGVRPCRWAGAAVFGRGRDPTCL